MQQVNQEGIYLTAPGASVCIEEAKSGAVAAAFMFDITHCWNQEAEAWDDWTQYQLQSPARLWFIKKDGTFNDNAIQTLKNIIGWNGDIDQLNGKLSVPAVQITISAETYNNKSRFVVNWIAAEDATPGGGGIKSANPEAINKIKQMYASRLKAACGAPAARPAGKPPTPAPAKPKPPTAKPKAATTNKDTAWAAFQKAQKEGDFPPEYIEGEWGRILAETYGADESVMTPGDWEWMATVGVTQIVPF